MLIPREWLCAILSISRCLASSSNSRSVRCAVMADSLCICRTSSLPIKSDRAVWSPDFRRASRLLVADRKSSCLTVAAYCISCACSASEKQESPNVGVANPASEFCVKQGGKSEIKRDKDGNEYGVCHLPDGTVVEEWEYFRQHNK